jgi:hypothetical protein
MCNSITKENIVTAATTSIPNTNVKNERSCTCAEAQRQDSEAKFK